MRNQNNDLLTVSAIYEAFVHLDIKDLEAFKSISDTAKNIIDAKKITILNQQIAILDSQIADLSKQREIDIKANADLLIKYQDAKNRGSRYAGPGCKIDTPSFSTDSVSV